MNILTTSMNCKYFPMDLSSSSTTTNAGCSASFSQFRSPLIFWANQKMYFKCWVVWGSWTWYDAMKGAYKVAISCGILAIPRASIIVAIAGIKERCWCCSQFGWSSPAYIKKLIPYFSSIWGSWSNWHCWMFALASAHYLEKPNIFFWSSMAVLLEPTAVLVLDVQACEGREP